MHLELIKESIIESIDELNCQLPPHSKINNESSQVIIGDGSLLDSLNLVNLLMDIESSLTNKTSKEFSILDQVFESAATVEHYTLSHLENDLVKLLS